MTIDSIKINKKNTAGNDDSSALKDLWFHNYEFTPHYSQFKISYWIIYDFIIYK